MSEAAASREAKQAAAGDDAFAALGGKEADIHLEQVTKRFGEMTAVDPAFAAKHAKDQQGKDHDRGAHDDLHRVHPTVVSARDVEDRAHAVSDAKSAGASFASGCSVT